MLLLNPFVLCDPFPFLSYCECMCYVVLDKNHSTEPSFCNALNTHSIPFLISSSFCMHYVDYDVYPIPGFPNLINSDWESFTCTLVPLFIVSVFTVPFQDSLPYYE